MPFDTESIISINAVDDFVVAPITGDLLEVPGIGPKSKANLQQDNENDQRILNTFQLFGKFLTLKDDWMSEQAHLDAFWYYLKLKGVYGGKRSTAVKAIYDKVKLLFPEMSYNELDVVKEEQEEILTSDEEKFYFADEHN